MNEKWGRVPIGLWVRDTEYDLIFRRLKTIEVVVGNTIINQALAGDKMYFQRGRDGDGYLLQCQVEDIERAPDFEEALLDIEWQRAFPSASFDEALSALERRFASEAVREQGVVMIGFTGLVEIEGDLLHLPYNN